MMSGIMILSRERGLFHSPAYSRHSVLSPRSLDKNLAKQDGGFMFGDTMKDRIYKGLSTRDPYLACEIYKKLTGEEPTIIVIRSEYPITSTHPLVVSSRHGAANMMLVSHTVLPEDLNGDFERTYTTIKPISFDPLSINAKKQSSSSKHKDIDHKSTCPHCGSLIKHYEDLGFWYGWDQGIIPPYWEDLRDYVFERDNFTCQKCHTKFERNNLSCHHIRPKEEGGTDSSRNLTTLCQEHHEDFHPIMPDTE